MSEEHMTRKKLPARVYAVASEDPSVLVAMDVSIDDQTIRWFDSVKGRVMKIRSIIDDNPEHFIFEREGGVRYLFEPLTIEIYRAKVKNGVLVPRDFDNQEDMLRAFEETREQQW